LHKFQPTYLPQCLLQQELLDGLRIFWSKSELVESFAHLLDMLDLALESQRMLRVGILPLNPCTIKRKFYKKIVT